MNMDYALRNTKHSGLLRKAAFALAVAIMLALIFVTIRSWVETAQQEPGGLEGIVRHSDFRSALTGALIISEGEGHHLYDLPTQRAAQIRVLAPYYTLDNTLLPYNHLPFEALSIMPLIGLPYPLVFGVWTLLMILSLALSLWLMHRAIPIARPVLFLVVLAAFSYDPLLRSLVLGQNSPLVLLGICAAYAAIRRGHPAWAGAALCLAALKPQVLPMILLLLVLQRHWRTLAVFAATFAASCLSVMLLLGVDWPVQYARLLLGVANWNNAGAIDPGIMHNWRGFATNLFDGWVPSLITPAFLLLSALSAGLLIYAWWRSRQALSTQHSALSTDLLWALAGVLAVLTSLHLNPHDLTLLIFPAWIIAAYALNGIWDSRTSMLWLTLLWVGYAIPTFGDPGALVVPSVLVMVLAAGLLTRRLLNKASAANQQPPAYSL